MDADPPPPVHAGVCDALLRRLVARRVVMEADATAADLALALPGFADETRWEAVRATCDQDVIESLPAFEAMLAADHGIGAICRSLEADRDAALLLGLLVAIETEPARRRLVAAIEGSATPTLGFLTELLSGRPVGLDRALRCLRRGGLVTVGAEGGWAQRTVTVAPEVVVVADGGTLEGGTSDDGTPGGSDLHGRALDGSDLAEHLEFLTAGQGPVRLLVAVGGDRDDRRDLAVEGLAAASVIVAAHDTVVDRMEELVRLATLTGTGIVIEVTDRLDARARSWIDRAVHLAWCVSSERELPLGDLPRRPWIERRTVAGSIPDAELAELVGDGAAAGRRLRREHLALLRRTAPGLEDPAAGLRRLAGGELDRLSTRITPRRTWADLVLDPEREELLRDVVRRFRHRTQVYDRWGFDPGGRAGVAVLFAGPPGTGKTLSAEVIAGELGLDLYRVDLASTVSKYIGETEKNLEAVFGAAEAADVVLLFDEADAVFGKRSDVGDAHDRYANLETAYLLQRIERFSGVAVLTTNLQSNLDQAFLRRIDVSVGFTMPGPEERLRIWTSCLTRGAPTEGLDLAFLADRFELSGGAIRNVAMTAAFLAADQATPIGMHHVVHGIRRELAKHSRLVDAAQFGPYAAHLRPDEDPRRSG